MGVQGIVFDHQCVTRPRVEARPRRQGGMGGSGMAPVPFSTVEEEEKGFSQITPLATFLKLPKRSRSYLLNLIEALKYFIKFCKNLGGFPLTLRSFTKFLMSK